MEAVRCYMFESASTKLHRKQTAWKGRTSPMSPEDQPFQTPPQLTDANFVFQSRGRVLPFAGCFGMLLVLFSLCIMPLFLIDTMRVALEKLHLSPLAAILAVGGILLGSV